MSRQELAELINAYLLKTAKLTTDLDGNYVGKLVRHDVAWDEREVSMKDG